MNISLLPDRLRNHVLRSRSPPALHIDMSTCTKGPRDGQLEEEQASAKPSDEQSSAEEGQADVKPPDEQSPGDKDYTIVVDVPNADDFDDPDVMSRHFTTKELKEVAIAAGVSQNGKKIDLCRRIIAARSLPADESEG